MERKENGIKWFDALIHNNFKVPSINPLPNFDNTVPIPKEVGMFISNRKNLILVSCNYYAWCIKLMRLILMNNLDLSLKWISQSALTPIYDKHSDADVICLVNLFEETKKGLLGGFINTCLNNGSQILIGISEGKVLEEACPYDLDTLEHEFEVLKI